MKNVHSVEPWEIPIFRTLTNLLPVDSLNVELICLFWIDKTVYFSFSKINKTNLINTVMSNGLAHMSHDRKLKTNSHLAQGDLHLRFSTTRYYVY